MTSAHRAIGFAGNCRFVPAFFGVALLAVALAQALANKVWMVEVSNIILKTKQRTEPRFMHSELRVPARVATSGDG